MQEEEYLIDKIFNKFVKSLPRRLRPHAFKIIFGTVCALVSVVFAHVYGWNTLLAIFIFIAVLSGAIFLLVLIEKLFRKIFNKHG